MSGPPGDPGERQRGGGPNDFNKMHGSDGVLGARINGGSH
jgi:hypothetical protein